MANSLEEAQKKYRAADEDFLAARKAFMDAPGTDRDQRLKTADNLEAATATLKDATTELARWVTGNAR